MEAKEPDNLCCLKKVVYGLDDASRNWCFSIKSELIKHGCVICSVDPAVFIFFDGRLNGLLLIHVDGIFWYGTAKLELKMIDMIRARFLVSAEESNIFKYIGIDLKKAENSVKVHQKQVYQGTTRCENCV